MNIDSAWNSALTGIRRGMEGLDRNAADVAGASKGDGKDIAAPLVESKQNKLQVQANVAMVKTLDETIGSLLDEKA